MLWFFLDIVFSVGTYLWFCVLNCSEAKERFVLILWFGPTTYIYKTLFGSQWIHFLLLGCPHMAFIKLKPRDFVQKVPIFSVTQCCFRHRILVWVHFMDLILERKKKLKSHATVPLSQGIVRVACLPTRSLTNLPAEFPRQRRWQRWRRWWQWWRQTSSSTATTTGSPCTLGTGRTGSGP